MARIASRCLWAISSLLLLLLGGSLLGSSTSFLSLTHQIILGAVFLLCILGAIKASSHLGQVGRIFIMVLCLFLTLRYWIFRITVTLAYAGAVDFAFALLLFAAETYGIMIYVFGMFVNVWPVNRVSPKLPEQIQDLPTVDVYIPTYNEPVEVVKITALACTQMNYPQDRVTIYILDDGGTQQKLNDPDGARAAQARKRADELKQVALDLSIIYATRDENLSAKAGNINEALMSCECVLDEDAFDRVSCVNHGIDQGCGDLILVLDCDHVPVRDFLQKTVGFFLQDPKLFLLQSPHFFINPDPVEKNLETFKKSPSENEMFYGAIHPGLDFWNASFFCGSAAVIRRKFLMEVGGIAGNTITEDAETALGLHAKGYTSAYLNTPLIIGLAPETFSDFIVQRSRWAQGMIQIFMLKNPLFQTGLSVFQKICYFNATFFWFFGLARAVFFISPLVLLFFGLRIYNASLEQVLAYAVPHLLGAYALSNFLFGKFRHPFFSELYETIQSIYLLPAIFSVIANPRAPVFKVTPKAVSLEKEFLSDLASPFYIMLIIAFAAYGFGIVKLIHFPAMVDSIAICMAWNTFNIILLLSCLGVVWEKRQIRKMHRYRTNEPIQLEMGEHRIPARIVDLSISGAGLEVDAALAREYLSALAIHADDSSGNDHGLPIKVHHQTQAGTHWKLGCSFLKETPAQLTRVVDFVYRVGRKTFNILLLLSCLGRGEQKQQIRKMHRYIINESIQLEAGDLTVPAKLVDLSVSGAGLEVDAVLSREQLQTLVIHANDSSGNSYCLPVEIQRQTQAGTHWNLGCSFLKEEPAQLTQIVNFVYGDSSRWKFYSKHHPSAATSNLTGFFRLLATGIYGFAANLSGVLSLIRNRIKYFFSRINTKIGPHPKDIP